MMNVNMVDFFREVESKKDFAETVSMLEASIENNRFKILHVHDVQATLAGKGIDHSAYKIIEFCRAPAAKIVLDADPIIGLFLPCKAIVFEKGSATRVGIFLPTAIQAFFPDADLGNLPEEIEKDIMSVISVVK